jgi:uncharacterized cupin superfamily protein
LNQKILDRPVQAAAVGAIRGQTVYPAPFADRVAGRSKTKLGDLFGLSNFGVNLTTLEPGAETALFHTHAVQDEFVFVLEGNPSLAFGEEEFQLAPGDCMGFRAGTGVGHHLINRTEQVVTVIEVGDRTPGERVEYPRDDIAAELGPGGAWVMTRKDGTPY